MAAGRDEITSSVAATSSKRPTILLLAVLDKPSVETKAASPIMVPSTVSALRPGRASNPADDSSSRSTTDIEATAGGVVRRPPAPIRLRPQVLLRPRDLLR